MAKAKKRAKKSKLVLVSYKYKGNKARNFCEIEEKDLADYAGTYKHYNFRLHDNPGRGKRITVEVKIREL
jgi:hypothetical protein